LESAVYGTIRSGFEYSGQKCSACSRVYVPQSMWPAMKARLQEEVSKIKLGSVTDADSFLSAVIDDKAFERIRGYLEHAKTSPSLSIVTGGECDDSKGYFVEPTIIETSDPEDKIISEEIFGPVVTVYPYPDAEYKEILHLINNTSPYALTGAVYTKDAAVLEEARDILRWAAGNFYENDKSTGSVVAQQPFGGARKSGTNDKAGSPHYLLKFVSPQSTKASTMPAREWAYPYMTSN